MRGKLKKFMALSFEEKKLFVEAYRILGVMRLALLLFPLKWLLNPLQSVQDLQALPNLSNGQKEVVAMIRNVVISASANTPWNSSCLVQSLSAKRMLQKRGIAGTLFIGVKKEEESSHEMTIHAWIQSGDQVVTGAEELEDFKVLSMYHWGIK